MLPTPITPTRIGRGCVCEFGSATDMLFCTIVLSSTTKLRDAMAFGFYTKQPVQPVMIRLKPSRW